MAAPRHPQHRSGLDMPHIRAICAHITEQDGAGPARITTDEHAARIQTGSIEQAIRLDEALTRVGYQVDRPRRIGRRDELTVPGWSRAGLAARLARMGNVAAELLAARPRLTERAIEMYRRVPDTAHDPHTAALDTLRDELRRWITTQAGEFAPYTPNRLPADPETAQLVRETWQAERRIDTLIDRQLLLSDQATRTFAAHRTATTDTEARRVALRDVSRAPEPPLTPNRWAGGTHGDGHPPVLAARDVPAASTAATPDNVVSLARHRAARPHRTVDSRHP